MVRAFFLLDNFIWFLIVFYRFLLQYYCSAHCEYCQRIKLIGKQFVY
jgi:hypothetical protein